MSEASCLKAQVTEHRHRGPSEQQHQGFFFIVPLAGLAESYFYLIAV